MAAQHGGGFRHDGDRGTVISVSGSDLHLEIVNGRLGQHEIANPLIIVVDATVGSEVGVAGGTANECLPNDLPRAVNSRGERSAFKPAPGTSIWVKLPPVSRKPC